MKNEQFQKKVYTKLSPFSLGSTLSPHSFVQEEDRPVKKIISSPERQSTREKFKKTFLPLLIDVIELRQMIESHKIRNPVEKIAKTPQEILTQLQSLQKEVEESQKWCEGIILQISKGIAEAKAALEGLSPTPKKSPLQRLLSWIKRR